MGAASGANVIITSHSAEKLDAALDTIHSTEGTVKAETIDVTSEDSVRDCFNRIGSLDHLFITASPGSTGMFLEQSVEAAKSYMDGKYWSTYRVTYHAIGHAAVFLMTNSFVTGTVLEVNGGWSLT